MKSIVPIVLTLRAYDVPALVIHQVPGETAPTIRVDAPRVPGEAARRLWQDLPAGVLDRFERYQRARHEILETQLGRPTVAELAGKLGVSQRTVFIWRDEFQEHSLGPLYWTGQGTPNP